MKTFIVVAAFIAVASAATPYRYSTHRDYSQGVKTTEHEQYLDIQPDGRYQYSYNVPAEGVEVSESGAGGVSAQGQFRYYAPDGTPIQLSYVADENGFQPSGSHLPQAPEIPQQIARALEYIRTHPHYEEPTPYGKTNSRGRYH